MSTQYRTVGRTHGKLWAMSLVTIFGLTACDEAGNFNLGGSPSTDVEGETETTATETGEFVEKDVESPDAFYAKETGLWDGRPSLGGVWVAHPDVSQPERVRIKNNASGKFVIGALFRRERSNPGPRLQLSSDAAQAIGVLAGAPVELEVVALRKEKVSVAPPPAPVEEAPAKEPEADTVPEPVIIEEKALDPIAAAEAAIETAPPTKVETEAVAAASTASPVISSTLPESSLDTPYIQVGTFSVENNAEQAANQMSRAGLVPTVRDAGSSAKPSWRVVVGPASTKDELQKMLKQVKDAGYSDAYVVPN